MASNATTIADEDGDYEDWIELYNPGESPVELSGLYLSDDPDNLFRWEMPLYTLTPGAYLLIFASGKDRISGPFFHTNFSIAASGEPIFITGSDGVVIDSYPSTPIPTDVSFGRMEDGIFPLVMFSAPTPGYSNAEGVVLEAADEALTFSHASGLYASPFSLLLSASNTGHTIRYTLDGSDPNAESAEYIGPLPISDRTETPNGISMVPTNPPGTYGSLGWQPPNGQVFKGTALKAQLYDGNSPSSPVYTQSYFVHPQIYGRYGQLPIVSLVTDSLHFFDYETGIYVPGLVHDTTTTIDAIWGYGNYNMRGMEWERPVHMTLIEPNGAIGLEQNMGVRIHGGGTRQMPIKSLRLYARNLYGNNEMPYAFFPWKDVDAYRRILLRTSGNDWRRTYFTDALSALLCKDMDLELQDYRPAVLFINGEFWGIHNFRDRIDPNFIAYTTGADPEHLDIIENWTAASEGSFDGYQSLIDYIATRYLGHDRDYEHVAEHIDIDNFIDYYIARQYSAVSDWPGNNVEFWRPTNPVGKWRWIFYDNDVSFQDYTFDAVENATTVSSNIFHGGEESIFLFNSLLENEQFKVRYLERFAYHLSTTFAKERINQWIDSLASNIAPVIGEHIDRWRWPANVDTWHQEVEILREFAEHRPCHMIYQLANAYGLHKVDAFNGICDSIIVATDQSSKPGNLDISIWPNPTRDRLNVRVEGATIVKSVAVWDLQGRMVPLHHWSTLHSDALLLLEFPSLGSGLYILEVTSAEGVLREKFVIDK